LAGNYSVTVRVYVGEHIYLDLVQNAGQIRVEKGDFFGTGRLPDTGTILVDHSWRYEPDEGFAIEDEPTGTRIGTETETETERTLGTKTGTGIET
jgi:hypothetical protein